MENEILYTGDCPNPGDFEKVQENLARLIKMQDEFYEQKKKQPLQPIKYYERGLN